MKTLLVSLMLAQLSADVVMIRRAVLTEHMEKCHPSMYPPKVISVFPEAEMNKTPSDRLMERAAALRACESSTDALMRAVLR